MTFETVVSIDFQALNKRDLKRLCQLARDEWGKPIDLRSSAFQMAEYLELYRQWKISQKAAEIKEVEEIEEVAPADFEKIEVVNEVVVPQEETTATTLSDFVDAERLPQVGITDAPLGDWFVSSPLSCDVCNGQYSELPQTPTQQASLSTQENQAPNYWNAWTRLYNACVARMKATRLGQLLKDEYEAECRAWWVNWERKYEESIATMKATKIEPLSTSRCVIENDAPASPVIVAVWILVAIALMLDAVVALVKQARDTQLIQKGFKAAVAAVKGRTAKARGFARA